MDDSYCPYKFILLYYILMKSLDKYPLLISHLHPLFSITWKQNFPKLALKWGERLLLIYFTVVQISMFTQTSLSLIQDDLGNQSAQKQSAFILCKRDQILLVWPH